MEIIAHTSFSEAKTHRVAQFAAGELRNLLSKVQYPGDLPARVELSLSMEIPPSSKAVYDGFRMEWPSHALIIKALKPKGLLNGVYELLYRLGFRFPYPGIDRCPSKPDWEAVRAFCRSGNWHIPGFRHRILHFDNMRLMPEAIDWAGKLRINMIQEPLHVYRKDIGANQQLIDMVLDRGIELNVGCHGFDNWLPPTVHGRKHPEYYATGHAARQGVFAKADDAQMPADFASAQLCLSHPDVAGIFADNVAQFLQEHPEVGTVSLWPNDMLGGWCECENCRALEPDPDRVDPQTNTPGRSASYLWFIGQVGRRVHAQCPDRRIEFAAFYDFATPPANPAVIPTDDYYLGFLVDDYYGCQYHGHGEPCNRPRIEAHHRRWRKLFPGEMYAVGYYADLCKIMDFPLVLVSKIKGDFEYLRAVGVDSVSTLVVCAAQDYLLRFLFPNLYGYAALAWEPTRRAEEILKELGHAIDPAQATTVAEYLHLWDRLGRVCPDKHAGWTWTDFITSEGPCIPQAQFLRTRELVDPATFGKMKDCIAQIVHHDSHDEIARRVIPIMSRAFDGFEAMWRLDTAAPADQVRRDVAAIRRAVADRGPFPAGVAGMLNRLEKQVSDRNT